VRRLRKGLEELNDPNLVLIPDEVIQAEWELERAAILKEIEDAIEP
jgi:hypothetical protein